MMAKKKQKIDHMSQINGAAGEIEEVPDDIWKEILVRVPATTVIKLKSVCKRWREMINSHNFQISHADHWRRIIMDSTDFNLSSQQLTQNLKSGQLLCQPSGRPVTTVVHHIYDDGLCLVVQIGNCICRGRLFLRNYLTKSQIELPFPDESPGYIINSHHLTFVYDPSTPGYVIFYVTPISKVVSSLRIELNGGGGRGPKIGSWQQLWSSEKLTLMFPETILSSFVATIFVNGKPHWLFDFKANNYTKTGILTIDAATEEAIVTKCSDTPSQANFFSSKRKFYCLNEALSGEALELWGIDDVDNPTWLKQLVIVKTDTEHPIFMSSIGLHMWTILKYGNRLIMYLYSSTGVNKIYIYDISLERWQIVNVVVDNSEAPQLITMALGSLSIYYGSLLSFN